MLPLHRAILGRVGRHIRARMIAGLLLLIPIGITYFILRFLFDNFDKVLEPVIEKASGRTVPGIGVAGLILLIYLVGLLGTNILGAGVIRFGEWMLMRIPLVRFVYGTSRQLIQSFSGTGATGFKRVVAIEYPRHGTWTIGFLTNMSTDETGKPVAIVYIPTAPTPQTGWVVIMPADQVYDTDLSVQAAMSFVLSGGFIAPSQIRKSPLRPAEEPTAAGEKSP